MQSGNRKWLTASLARGASLPGSKLNRTGNASILSAKDAIGQIMYSVDGHVEGAWFPNLINTKQTRHFQFEGSRLVLNADTDWGQVQIVWERLAAAPESA